MLAALFSFLCTNHHLHLQCYSVQRPCTNQMRPDGVSSLLRRHRLAVRIVRISSRRHLLRICLIENPMVTFGDHVESDSYRSSPKARHYARHDQVEHIRLVVLWFSWPRSQAAHWYIDTALPWRKTDTLISRPVKNAIPTVMDTYNGHTERRCDSRTSAHLSAEHGSCNAHNSNGDGGPGQYN